MLVESELFPISRFSCYSRFMFLSVDHCGAARLLGCDIHLSLLRSCGLNGFGEGSDTTDGVSAFQSLREWREIALLLTFLFSPYSRSAGPEGPEESRAGERRAIGPGGPMEAGGIEPPSRDISTMPSTCVVANLKSRQPRPLATGYSANQLRTFFSFPRA